MNSKHQHITYKGGAFHNDSETGKSFGNITVSMNEIGFESENFRAVFPIQGTVIKTGGANNHMIFFSHPSVSECTVFTSDHSILHEPGLTSYTHIARQIAMIQKRKTYAPVLAVAAIILIVISVYGIFKLKEPLCIAIAKRIPVKWEQKLGDAALSQLKSGKQFVEDEETIAMLNQIAKPLLTQIPEKRYTLTLHIIKDPAVNAFALPGGHIVFNTGLILKAKSSEEVAGVLAHETAHVTLQHGLRQLIGSVGIYLLVQAFFGDTTGLLAVMVDNTTFLLTQKYSRDYEREADEIGWNYLVNANINPYGMINFFNTLLTEQEKDNLPDHFEKSLNFLSTHPSTRERIEALQEKWKKMNTPSGFIQLTPNIEKLQEKIDN